MPDAAFRHAIALEMKGETRSAEKVYLLILENEDDPRVAVNLGHIYYNERLYGLAADYFRKAIRIDPKYALAWFNLGNALDDLKSHHGAIDAYQQAVKLAPRYGDAHYNLAIAYENAGNPGRALKHWRAYLKLDPADAYAMNARRAIRKIVTDARLAVVR